MNTPSHFLMTAALEKSFTRVPIVKSAFLIGAVAPDLPLWILSIGSIGYYHLILGWTIPATFHFVFEELYFHNPLWIASHNLLHSPTLLLIALALLWRKRRNINSSSRWWFWFLLACLFHTTVDIFTHVDDGPLLFFPLNWNIRFHSSVSYWDERYYGREFEKFEQALDAVLLIYLFIPSTWQRVRNWIKSHFLRA